MGNSHLSAFSLSDQEFAKFQALLFDIAGIHLTPAKKTMLAGRLQRRIRAYSLASYGDYFRLLQQQEAELQIAVDLLTTNETYFFREPKHFEFLQKQILSSHPDGQRFRIWSAACSSGEEAYSLAMLMSEHAARGCSWEIVAYDICVG